MSEKVITIWANSVINVHGARTVQYAGFEGNTVKHEPLRCIYLSRLLNWVYNFAVRALKDANRLITDSKSRLRTRLLSIAMRHKALRRSSDTVVRGSFFTGDSTEKDLSPAVSNRHREIDISVPKVVENFRYTGRSGPLLGPGPWGFSLTSLMDDPAL